MQIVNKIGNVLKNKGNKIIYITAQAPWGSGETFIIEEILALLDTGAEIMIIPRNPPKELFHTYALDVLKNSKWIPLLSFRIIIFFFISLLINPQLWRVLGSILLHSKNWRNLAKNLVIVPKGVYVANILQKEKDIKHVHAHWASTTSTLAYVVSRLTGIPWSFTAHSGMILWNNMIAEKVKTSIFTRVISQHRHEDLLKIVEEKYYDKIITLHVGVSVPKYDIILSKTRKQPQQNVIGCIGHLNRIKGQKYLIKACYLLKKQGFNFKCLIIGEGKERKKLEILIDNLSLNAEIELIGEIPHNEVINILHEDKIEVLVLPSITLPLEKRAEGTPVVLMESMANGIPVISTSTGGIPEILGYNSEILVPEKNSEALKEAIIKVLTDHNFREKLILQGYNKVSTEFNIKLIAQSLVKYFEGDYCK